MDSLSVNCDTDQYTQNTGHAKKGTPRKNSISLEL